MKKAHSPHDRSSDYDQLRRAYSSAVIKKIATSCQRKQRFLDVGTGTGILALELLKHFDRGVGVDTNNERIKYAREQRRKLKLTGSIRFQICGAESLPFADRAFDLVTVAQAFHWFDHARALKEFYRVLRPGGTLAILWKYPDPTSKPRRLAKACIPDLRTRDMKDQLLRTCPPELFEKHGFQSPVFFQSSVAFRYSLKDWAALIAWSAEKSEALENQYIDTLRKAARGKFRAGVWEHFDHFLFISKKQ